MGDGGLDLTVGSQSISMVLLLRLTVIFFAAIHRALGAPLITSSIPHTAQVLLPYGQLIGNRLELVDEYLGVPYAKPPTRFEPPQAWSSPYPNGTWKASEYSDICLQVVRDPNDILHPTGSVHGSEDCLHLNIYTPRHGRKPLPVMLWIHGGVLTQGSAMNPLFNGSHLAASQRVVVVAINYRLNALGFLAIQRDDGTTSSNNGLRDQQEAMRFVKRNIAAFGGQPNNVTIFGESAGGLSVGVHLVSPTSANLFAAAISDIIKPTTRKTRLRFAELPGMEQHVKATKVFVSTCWGAEWGTLVGAVVEGVPMTSAVWIDVFADTVPGSRDGSTPQV